MLPEICENKGLTEREGHPSFHDSEVCTASDVGWHRKSRGNGVAGECFNR